VRDRADFVRAWNLLQPAEQETLALALWDDISSSDAARILHISTPAFRTRLNRARTSLRQHLDTFPSAAPARPSLRTHS
jgi:RNA polymerase sigma-70 factor (ECF subfamily)